MKDVIVSAGINNSYGHPHKEALDRFSKMNAKIYGTYDMVILLFLLMDYHTKLISIK